MMIKGLFIFMLVIGAVIAEHQQAGPACGECQVNINGVCKRVRSCVTEDSGLHPELFKVLKQKKQQQDELASSSTP